MFNDILVAYDGSENSRRALDVAAELSAKFEAKLTVVHVLMHGRPGKELIQMAEVEHIVETAKKAVAGKAGAATGTISEIFDRSGTDTQAARVIAAVGDQLLAFAKRSCEDKGARKVRTVATSGDYADEILQTAADVKADTIVVGCRGLGIIPGVFLGSVSHKVVQHADCTVVTTR